MSVRVASKILMLKRTATIITQVCPVKTLSTVTTTNSSHQY